MKRVKSEGTMAADRERGAAKEDDLGFAGLPLCLEPWESYYILRRGIMPCCYGHAPIDLDMSNWSAAWNSPELQRIRDHLRRGELSRYCRDSLGCPIVQRVLLEERGEIASPSSRPPLLRMLNKAFLGLPGRVYRILRGRKPGSG